jgi:hypothetical protein
MSAGSLREPLPPGGESSKGHGYTCMPDDLCFAKGSTLIGLDLI